VNGVALCAGVGGLDLGLRLALGESYRTVCYVEREAYAAAALVARMEDKALDLAPVWDDVTTFRGEPWRGVVDLVTAGFPCQPWSVAGKRKGTSDSRWLWPDIARIIRECEPRYVFLENVPGLYRHGLRVVLSDLAALGFDAEWDCVSAGDVGAPHRRERVFILAHREGSGLWSTWGRWRRQGQPDGSLANVAYPPGERREGLGLHVRPGRPQQAEGEAAGGGAGVADAEDVRWRAEQREQPDGVLPSMGHASGSRTSADTEGGSPRRATGESGNGLAFPPGPGGDWSAIPEWLWPAQPVLRGLADGLAPRVDRLRSAGNGVHPLAAAHAFRTLAARLVTA
jgi:DNA (cytosine-5)-methyltransferase 1